MQSQSGYHGVMTLTPSSVYSEFLNLNLNFIIDITFCALYKLYIT